MMEARFHAAGNVLSRSERLNIKAIGETNIAEYFFKSKGAMPSVLDCLHYFNCGELKNR